MKTETIFKAVWLLVAIAFVYQFARFGNAVFEVSRELKRISLAIAISSTTDIDYQTNAMKYVLLIEDIEKKLKKPAGK